MAAAGLESSMSSFETATYSAEDRAFLESIGARTHFLAYQLAMSKDTLGGKEWDPKKPAEMQQALLKWLKSQPMAKPSKLNKPELAVFFAEPLLGPVSYMSQPEHYGEPPHQLTPKKRPPMTAISISSSSPGRPSRRNGRTPSSWFRGVFPLFPSHFCVTARKRAT